MRVEELTEYHNVVTFEVVVDQAVSMELADCSEDFTIGLIRMVTPPW